MIISQSTQKKIAQYTANPHQALLLIGKKDIGKKNIVSKILNELNLNETSLLKIEPSKTGSISIDQIREINHFFTLKNIDTDSSSNSINRAVVVFEADAMSEEAQNSLLKNLEEPPSATIFILTSSNPTHLLPTIRSRLTVLQVDKPSQQDLADYIQTKGHGLSQAEQNRVLNLSDGLPDKLEELLRANDHQVFVASEIAKNLLAADTYTRLVKIDQLTKDQELSVAVLNMMSKIAEYSITNNSNQIDKWIAIFTESQSAIEALSKNAQTKLVLTKVMLSI